MIRPLELAIGLRHLWAKRRVRFISFISLISVLGIALGVAALITVLSVMNGFEKELRGRILGMASHATIARLKGPIPNWRETADLALVDSSVLAAAPYVEGQAMLTSGGAVRGVLVRGIEPDEERRVSEISSYMISGSLDELEAGAFRIVVGSTLATRLRLDLGSRVTAIAPEANASPAGVVPRHRRFVVAGIFEAGHGQYDSSFALMHIEDAGRLFQVRDGVSGLRLQLDDVFAAPRLAREIAASLGGRYWVTDWTRYHAQFFRALRIEKTAMFIILTLIVAVAAFNLVSTLVMVVNEKRAEIAILRTLGLTPASVLLIFLVQGTLIGLVGTGVGAAAGVALAANLEVVVPFIEGLIGQKFLSPEIYYLSDVPADIRRNDVVAIVIVAFVMSVVATLYPAWRGANTQPAEALRHE
ncbi:MAG: lipoprotein-releasing ABC transporter permease subunit [Immundisolibacterales bacterium]|nr:lipoprotein-releasing ABC transporter permease subunit [Immundisolibacterales bacterium]